MKSFLFIELFIIVSKNPPQKEAAKVFSDLQADAAL